MWISELYYIVLALVVIIPIFLPIKNCPVRYAFAFILILSLVEQVYFLYVLHDKNGTIQYTMIPQILLAGVLSVSMAVPMTHRFASIGPFYEEKSIADEVS
jgi:hypothetical protein